MLISISEFWLRFRISAEFTDPVMRSISDTGRATLAIKLKVYPYSALELLLGGVLMKTIDWLFNHTLLNSCFFSSASMIACLINRGTLTKAFLLPV